MRSTDRSFAEQALLDTSVLLATHPGNEHLPSRLYKMAGEYWNKYPKTDYTYSPLSKDRVELAPGQVAMPNMSRRSLSQLRAQRSNTSIEELGRPVASTAWTSSTVRKRSTNKINRQCKRVRFYLDSILDDIPFSPILASYYLSRERGRPCFGSPLYSACSTDRSFAEQALLDTSVLLATHPGNEHLPSRLYKMAGEYWNKYPKTDYTYSPLSKDRVELAPGQVAMPNMSRRSLSQFRAQRYWLLTYCWRARDRHGVIARLHKYVYNYFENVLQSSLHLRTFSSRRE